MRGNSKSMDITTNTTTTANVPTHLPKHFQIFEKTGWALRTHKPSRRIDKAVKDYIHMIYEEETMNGRKLVPEEYVDRIRSARHSNGKKIFTTAQYLTASQVR
jgi:hypothetical protein